MYNVQKAKTSYTKLNTSWDLKTFTDHGNFTKERQRDKTGRQKLYII